MKEVDQNTGQDLYPEKTEQLKYYGPTTDKNSTDYIKNTDSKSDYKGNN